MLRKINNKSDFDFILKLMDSDGNSVGWVDANWEATIYTTSKNFSYTASYAYGEKTNCVEQDGDIVIVVDGHEFPVGELLIDFTIDIPDTRFPDGSRHVSVTGEKTDIEMVLDRGHEAEGMVVNIRVPYVKKNCDETDEEVGDEEKVGE